MSNVMLMVFLNTWFENAIMLIFFSLFEPVWLFLKMYITAAMLCQAAGTFWNLFVIGST